MSWEGTFRSAVVLHEVLSIPTAFATQLIKGRPKIQTTNWGTYLSMDLDACPLTIASMMLLYVRDTLWPLERMPLTTASAASRS